MRIIHPPFEGVLRALSPAVNWSEFQDDHTPPSTAEFNPLKPNEAYRGRTAPLTSKIAFYIFIQPI